LELTRTVFGLQDEVEIGILDQGTLQLIKNIQPVGNVAHRQESATDYYVICLSRWLNLRLFDDFVGSDSCVIVRDIRGFARRLFQAVRKMLPGWSGKLHDVMYYDPFNPPQERDLYFSKHFGYAYQREIRFVWTPPRALHDLTVQAVKTGPLRDICDFLTLPT
jgi:hypothetical protein